MSDTSSASSPLPRKKAPSSSQRRPVRAAAIVSKVRRPPPLSYSATGMCDLFFPPQPHNPPRVSKTKEHRVVAVTGHMDDGDGLKYRVHWADGDLSWEPVTNLFDRYADGSVRVVEALTRYLSKRVDALADEYSLTQQYKAIEAAEKALRERMRQRRQLKRKQPLQAVMGVATEDMVMAEIVEEAEEAEDVMEAMEAEAVEQQRDVPVAAPVLLPADPTTFVPFRPEGWLWESLPVERNPAPLKPSPFVLQPTPVWFQSPPDFFGSEDLRPCDPNCFFCPCPVRY
jgi:hypothetical protein